MGLLRRGQHERPGQQERVRINVPRFAVLTAVVVRTVPGAAELALLGAPTVPIRFLHRRRATLSPLEGHEQLPGSLLAVPGDDGRIRPDVLHFLETVVPITETQRRDDARIDLVRPVAMVPQGFQIGWLNGQTRNLSANGVLVTGADALEHGDQLRLRFELRDEEDVVDLRARVVRSDDRTGLRGLRLDGADPRERERLRRFVFERQRIALAELRALRSA